MYFIFYKLNIEGVFLCSSVYQTPNFRGILLPQTPTPIKNAFLEFEGKRNHECRSFVSIVKFWQHMKWCFCFDICYVYNAVVNDLKIIVLKNCQIMLLCVYRDIVVQ